MEVLYVYAAKPKSFWYSKALRQRRLFEYENENLAAYLKHTKADWNIRHIEQVGGIN